MLEKSLLLKAKNIPNTFGVYMFIDVNKSPIYVGKSNNLKTRVLSYFKKRTEKDELIIKHAINIEYILVNNEKDAFLLENNLIKKYQPKYNILLKDDKNYPWLCISKDIFPKVFIVRNKINQNNLYFGPFLSYKKTVDLLNTIKKVFPVINCSYVKNSKLKKNKSICLSCQISKCEGPCTSYFSEKDYNKVIDSIKRLLKGNFNKLIKDLSLELNKYSNKLMFEKAEIIKNQIIALRTIKHKSIIISSKNVNIDSFCVIQRKNIVYINFIRVIEGSVYFMKNIKSLNENNWDLIYFLDRFISNIYVDFGFISKEIISNIHINNFHGRKLIIPKSGYKKKLLDLGLRNIINFINRKNESNYNKLIQLKDDLKIKKTPFYIECFDISHLKGKYTIGSCVVFKNGKPSKKDYRFFNIKSFEGINDYLAIEEVLNRRYTKLKKLPDLVVIDGGKGQLTSAKKIINKLEIKEFELLSIAKKEEIIYKENGEEIILDKKSQSLKLIQQLRDEAHRFCLKNHRKKRDKSFIKTELDSVPGIGYLTIKKLLKKFKSTQKMRMLAKEELISFIGKSKGLKVYEYLKK
tara:strand:+ start:2477 stop:4210 length:1734 start_codon:yes stop_codon:yes gene_type:complete